MVKWYNSIYEDEAYTKIMLTIVISVLLVGALFVGVAFSQESKDSPEIESLKKDLQYYQANLERIKYERAYMEERNRTLIQDARTLQKLIQETNQKIADIKKKEEDNAKKSKEQIGESAQEKSPCTGPECEEEK